jgi:phosphoglycolate phosphatase-like HAD superfamily hydrolase
VLAPRPLLFFDLDGPLLDVRRRYHGVYASIAAELCVRAFELEEYWAAKRRREPLRDFFPGVQDPARLREIYMDRWLARIEAPEWLSQDRLVHGAPECLAALERSHELYLVTLRRDPLALAWQLDAIGLRSYFQDVLSGWAEREEGSRLKAGWMRPLVAGGTGVIVGDSEVDMQAAALLDMRAIGVSFGIREAHELIALGAKHVIDDLKELPALLAEPSVETIALSLANFSHLEHRG